MLVLIDESGDPGFRLVRGSSSHFVMAMVLFEANEEAERASLCIGRTRERLRVKPEFKFAKSHVRVRDGFFEAVCPFRFKVRALVVDKARIHSRHLRENTDAFYSYFVQLLLRHDDGSLRDAVVKVDGSGDRQFKKQLNAYLRKQLAPGQVRSVKFYDSRSDNLLQLADMCAGAILRARREDERSDRRWLGMLERAGRIDDVWSFR